MPLPLFLRPLLLLAHYQARAAQKVSAWIHTSSQQFFGPLEQAVAAVVIIGLAMQTPPILWHPVSPPSCPEAENNRAYAQPQPQPYTRYHPDVSPPSPPSPVRHSPLEAVSIPEGLLNPITIAIILMALCLTAVHIPPALQHNLKTSWDLFWPPWQDRPAAAPTPFAPSAPSVPSAPSAVPPVSTNRSQPDESKMKQGGSEKETAKDGRRERSAVSESKRAREGIASVPEKERSRPTETERPREPKPSSSSGREKSSSGGGLPSESQRARAAKSSSLEKERSVGEEPQRENARDSPSGSKAEATSALPTSSSLSQSKDGPLDSVTSEQTREGGNVPDKSGSKVKQGGSSGGGSPSEGTNKDKGDDKGKGKLSESEEVRKTKGDGGDAKQKAESKSGDREKMMMEREHSAGEPSSVAAEKPSSSESSSSSKDAKSSSLSETPPLDPSDTSGSEAHDALMSGDHRPLKSALKKPKRKPSQSKNIYHNYFMTMRGFRPALVPFPPGLHPKPHHPRNSLWWDNVPKEVSHIMAPPALAKTPDLGGDVGDDGKGEKEEKKDVKEKEEKKYVKEKEEKKDVKDREKGKEKGKVEGKDSKSREEKSSSPSAAETSSVSLSASKPSSSSSSIKTTSSSSSENKDKEKEPAVARAEAETNIKAKKEMEMKSAKSGAPSSSSMTVSRPSSSASATVTADAEQKPVHLNRQLQKATYMMQGLVCVLLYSIHQELCILLLVFFVWQHIKSQQQPPPPTITSTPSSSAPGLPAPAAAPAPASSSRAKPLAKSIDPTVAAKLDEARDAHGANKRAPPTTPVSAVLKGDNTAKPPSTDKASLRTQIEEVDGLVKKMWGKSDMTDELKEQLVKAARKRKQLVTEREGEARKEEKPSEQGSSVALQSGEEKNKGKGKAETGPTGVKKRAEELVAKMKEIEGFVRKAREVVDPTSEQVAQLKKAEETRREVRSELRAVMSQLSAEAKSQPSKRVDNSAPGNQPSKSAEPPALSSTEAKPQSSKTASRSSTDNRYELKERIRETELNIRKYLKIDNRTNEQNEKMARWEEKRRGLKNELVVLGKQLSTVGSSGLSAEEKCSLPRAIARGSSSE